MISKSELKQVVYGPYVATPIPNAFNNKTAYWLSKDGYTLSMYMFSVDNFTTKRDLQELLSKENVLSYVVMLEERMMRKYDSELYMDFRKLVDSGFDWEKKDICEGLEEWKQYEGLLKNLEIVRSSADEETWAKGWKWHDIGTFVHYYDYEKLKTDMKYLMENGYIFFKERKNGFMDLKILKQM